MRPTPILLKRAADKSLNPELSVPLATMLSAIPGFGPDIAAAYETSTMEPEHLSSGRSAISRWGRVGGQLGGGLLGALLGGLAGAGGGALLGGLVNNGQSFSLGPMAALSVPGALLGAGLGAPLGGAGVGYLRSKWLKEHGDRVPGAQDKILAKHGLPTVYSAFLNDPWSAQALYRTAKPDMTGHEIALKGLGAAAGGVAGDLLIPYAGGILGKALTLRLMNG